MRLCTALRKIIPARRPHQIYILYKGGKWWQTVEKATRNPMRKGPKSGQIENLRHLRKLPRYHGDPVVRDPDMDPLRKNPDPSTHPGRVAVKVPKVSRRVEHRILRSKSKPLLVA
mmetsp:Transcript_11036/g.27100  ORF Transcript_11036/g.27100 Transcript_11036/m.27100 type:complete len:115 (-) Transcript_11036:1613-1957(-)